VAGRGGEAAAMNYRHAYHAGNFADLVKHGLLLWLLGRMASDERRMLVVDTHAGSGLYDLGEGAARSREAQAGIARLMSAPRLPNELAELKAAVAGRNGGGETVRWYPGSPVLIADSLRTGDRYVACELRPEEHDLLAERLKARDGVQTRQADGYEVVLTTAADGRRRLVLIDPPFERPDDYVRCAETAGALMRQDPQTVMAIWLPIKDMETFDGFLRRLTEAGVKRALVAEARLRPLTNPMKMNGCAVVLINPPEGAQAAAQGICEWTAIALGEPDGRGEAWWT
jgi:23S rRNA (adenine2030-N6)-methyltransferase